MFTNPKGLGISGSVFSHGRNKGIPKLAEISKPDSQRKAAIIFSSCNSIELTNPEGLGISGSVFFLGRNKGIPKLAENSKPDLQSLIIELTNPKGLGISGFVFFLLEEIKGFLSSQRLASPTYEEKQS